MTQPKLDPHELAAFIEGRLRGSERDRVVRILAQSEDEYDAFVAALKVAEELGGSSLSVAPTVRSRSRFHRLRRRALQAAAAVAILVAGSFTIQRIITSSGQIELLATSVAGAWDEGALQALPDGWDVPGWAVTRGDPTQLISPVIAFRLGVRAVDFQVAVRRSNLEEAGFYTGEMLELLTNVTASQPVQVSYRQLQSAIESGVNVDSLRTLAGRAELQVEVMLPSSSFGLGKWIEGARVAVMLEDVGFFSSQDTRRFLDDVRDAEIADDVSTLMRQLYDNIDAGVERNDLPTLGAQIQAIIEAGAGG